MGYGLRVTGYGLRVALAALPFATEGRLANVFDVCVDFELARKSILSKQLKRCELLDVLINFIVNINQMCPNPLNTIEQLTIHSDLAWLS